jgi:membrane fusion protein (multidrug efflux system)
MNKLPRAVLVLAALTFVSPLPACNRGKKKGEEKDPPVSVQVQQVRLSSIAQTLRYDADVRGVLEVRVFSQVPERIVARRVEPGDTVKRGQILAIVRADTLSDNVQSAAAAIDAARADRDNLKAELDRQAKLLARRIVSQAVVDQLQARLRSAEAQIRRLEAMARQASTVRGNAVIRSPISGVVGQCTLDQGDMAAPTIPICTVVRPDPVELRIEVPERDLARIKEKMQARVRVSRFPGRDFRGTVERIYPTIDRVTRTAKIKVVIKNPGHELMSGMLARVWIEVERHDDTVVVPYSSLIIEMGARGETTHRVYVLDKDGKTAADRTVRLGIVDENRVEVTAGLGAGDLLVTRGQHLLRPGRTVKVVERLDPARAPADRKPKPTAHKP